MRIKLRKKLHIGPDVFLKKGIYTDEVEPIHPKIMALIDTPHAQVLPDDEVEEDIVEESIEYADGEDESTKEEIIDLVDVIED